MTELQTVNEIHEQQLSQLLRDCTPEERQFLNNKFTQHRHTYLHNLTDFQKIVDGFVKDRKLNKKPQFDKLYNELIERNLTNEKLDFDEVMKDFIDSEYDDEDFFFVTSDDPTVQSALGSSAYESLIDEDIQSQLQSKNDYRREYYEKKVEEMLEENADPDFEYDNPIRLTKQQAIKVFTGKDKVAKQFKVVKSGVAKSLIIAHNQSTGTITDESVDKKFVKRVNKAVIHHAITQIRNYAEKKLTSEEVEEKEPAEEKKSKKKNKKAVQQPKNLLMQPDSLLQIVVNILKPAEGNIIPLALPLPHPLKDLEDINILVIVRDAQKQAFKDLIAGEDYASNTKVLALSKLSREYKEYDKKRLLSKQYDLVFSEKYILPIVHDLLGKKFHKTSQKLPVAVTIENLKENITNYSQGAKVVIQQGVPSINIDIAKLELSVENIEKNVLEVLKNLPKHLPGGANNIKKILLKTQNSPSLPIYYASSVRRKYGKKFKAEIAFKEANKPAKGEKKQSTPMDLSENVTVAPKENNKKAKKSAKVEEKKKQPEKTAATTVPQESNKRKRTKSAKQPAAKKQKQQ